MLAYKYPLKIDVFQFNSPVAMGFKSCGFLIMGRHLSLDSQKSEVSSEITLCTDLAGDFYIDVCFDWRPSFSFGPK